jgi:hypothetical protein
VSLAKTDVKITAMFLIAAAMFFRCDVIVATALSLVGRTRGVEAV